VASFSMREVDKPASPSISPSRQRETLLEAVDQGLAVPSEIVRAAIYERIERSYQVRREEISEKVEILHKALQDLLGAGAKVMEKLIARSLYSRLGLSFTEHANWTLADYVNHVKKESSGE